MAKIKLHELIDGYEFPKGEKSAGRRFWRREITGSLTVSTSRQRKSKINQAAQRISNVVNYTDIRTYAFSFLTFGLLTVLFYFAADILTQYIPDIPIENNISLAIGAVFAILAIPMLFLEGPISQILQEYMITDVIFFDFLCIKRVPPAEHATKSYTAPAVVIGVILAVAGIFVPTAWVVGAVLFLAYFYLSFSSPEFSLFSTILILPYLSIDSPEGYGILATLVVITAVAFVRKLVFGKRILNFEQYDILIFLMLLAVLISGIFLKGSLSFGWSIKYISLSLVYILAGNIITNRRLADCAVNAVIFSSALPAFTSIVDFIRLLISNGNIEELYYNGISSVFSSREIAAAHFVVSVAMAVAMAIQSKGFARAGYIIVGVLVLAGLVLTFEPFAYIAFLVSVLAYFALRGGGFCNLLLLPLAAVPYLILLLPGDFLLSVFGMTTDGVAPKDILLLWEETFSIFKEHVFFGIGIGSEAFSEEIKGFLVKNSHNLFLEIMTEAGIFALIFFLIIIWVRMRHRITYRRYLKNSDVKLISASAASAIFALVTLGATTYIWQDLSLYYLFWCVFGIGSATLRIAKRDNDDKVLYYRIDSDSDKWDVSLGIKNK